MMDANIVIYALGGVVVILSLILSTRLVKRRKNKPENIWENSPNTHVSQRLQASPPPPPPPPPMYRPNQPMSPPSPRLFSYR